MTFKTNKIDEANATITGTIPSETIEKNIDKVAAQAAKTMDVQGFRKGKVPLKIVKQRYADKIKEDAQSEAIRDTMQQGLKELNIEQNDIIGEPQFTKYDQKEDGSLEFELNLSCRPKIELGDYKKLVPEIKKPEITEKEVENELLTLASQSAPLEKIKRKRAVKSGDFAVIDFEGFKGGVPFEGGKAEKHTLEIGSNSFIPGFEDQVIGMQYDEEKDINLKFPENYQAKELAGHDVTFKVKLHEIQEKVAPEINDELVKKFLPNEETATLDTLKEKIKENLFTQKKQSYFTEEIKPTFTKKLIEAIEFAVPNSIVDQEINQVINSKVRSMSEAEIKTLQENPDEVKKLQEEARPNAVDSVKATFLIDALAKVENVNVTDQEVSQTLYYEAMMNGQNGNELIKQYEDAGYLPMIKMSMIESKVMNKIFNEALGEV